jgi:uncharacterized membrane protein
MGPFLVFFLVALAVAALGWFTWEGRDEEFAEDDRPMYVAIGLALLAETMLIVLLLKALFGWPDTIPGKLVFAVIAVGTARLSLPFVRSLLNQLISR